MVQPWALLLVQALAMALPASSLWPMDLVAAPVVAMLTAAAALGVAVPFLQMAMLGMPQEQGRVLGAAGIGQRIINGFLRGAPCFYFVAVAMACCRWGWAWAAGWSRCFVYVRPLTCLEDVAVALPTYGALIGAWVGGCAGPLDWEQEWQEWPIASGYGTCGGAAVGCLLASASTALNAFQ